MTPYYFRVDVFDTITRFPYRPPALYRWNWDYSPPCQVLYLAVMPPTAQIVLDPGPTGQPVTKSSSLYVNTGTYEAPLWAQTRQAMRVVWQEFQELDIVTPRRRAFYPLREVPERRALAPGKILCAVRTAIDCDWYIHDENTGTNVPLPPLWYIRADDMIPFLGGIATREPHPYQVPEILADWLQDRDQYQQEAALLRHLLLTPLTPIDLVKGA